MEAADSPAVAPAAVAAEAGNKARLRTARFQESPSAILAPHKRAFLAE